MGAAAASARLDGDAVHSVTMPAPGAQLPLMEPMATMGADISTAVRARGSVATAASG